MSDGLDELFTVKKLCLRDNTPQDDVLPDGRQVAPSGYWSETRDEDASVGGVEHNETPKPAKASRAVGQALRLTYFDDCSHSVKKLWILKGLIARGETSSWIGPPGSGKSALLTEISIACAAELDWRGHKAKEGCGIVYFALERADLQKRRFRAHSKRDGHLGLPIAIADEIVDLMRPDCTDKIIATVRAAEQHFGCKVGLVVIDTFAKGIAAGGGDEDKARDQNMVMANLRRVHSEISVHIAIVGHTGKNEDRGARGSNAHVGDVDLMVQISGSGAHIKTAEIIKANDQPERVLGQFKLQCVELGKDEDGDPITTAIVSDDDMGEASASTRAGKAKVANLAQVPKAALRALVECLGDGLSPPPADEHVPAGAKGVTLARWRERLAKLSIINEDGNPRQQLSRIVVTLRNAGKIGTWEDFVWPVT